MPRIAHITVNIVLFQIGWLVCVLGAVNDVALMGLLFALTAVGTHLFFTPMLTTELQMLFFVVLTGIAWETAMVQLGFMVYVNGIVFEGLPPYWILAMWLLFATTLNLSLRWLHGRMMLAAILGLLFGPITYFAGSKLGGVSFPDTFHTLAVIAVSWALLMPMLAILAKRLDGFPVTNEGAYA